MWMYYNQLIGEEHLKLGDPETALKHLKKAYDAMLLQDLPRDFHTRQLFILAVTSLRMGEVEKLH